MEKIGETDNGTKINNWEIIESKTETERFILQWMQLYQGQAKETPYQVEVGTAPFKMNIFGIDS